jgi:hypothetical protein
MTAGKEYQFLCTQHGKNPKKCCATDYIFHNLEATMKVLLNPSFYPDRFEINDYTAKTFLKMIKYLYRTLAHISLASTVCVPYGLANRNSHI